MHGPGQRGRPRGTGPAGTGRAGPGRAGPGLGTGTPAACGAPRPCCARPGPPPGPAPARTPRCRSLQEGGSRARTDARAQCSGRPAHLTLAAGRPMRLAFGRRRGRSVAVTDREAARAGRDGPGRKRHGRPPQPGGVAARACAAVRVGAIKYAESREPEHPDGDSDRLGDSDSEATAPAQLRRWPAAGRRDKTGQPCLPGGPRRAEAAAADAVAGPTDSDGWTDRAGHRVCAHDPRRGHAAAAVPRRPVGALSRRESSAADAVTGASARLRRSRRGGSEPAPGCEHRQRMRRRGVGGRKRERELRGERESSEREREKESASASAQAWRRRPETLRADGTCKPRDVTRT
jgi:hypothetical protein